MNPEQLLPQTAWMKIAIWLLLPVLVSHLTGRAQETDTNSSIRPTDSLHGNILVINSYDVMAQKYRKSKKELFLELVDSLKQILYESTPAPNGKMIIIPALLKDTITLATMVDSLMVQNSASRAIVIMELDAYFNQTGVEVSKDEHGKSREASYDLCANINYRLHQKGANWSQSKIANCEFFTTRSVVSGLFAAGPDIVGKKKHVFEIVRKNALEYLAKEMPWK
jgi:hypothetical protein